MVSKSRRRGAKETALSELEGLLEKVGLGVTTVHARRGVGTEFQILEAATLKQRTTGAESRLV